METNPISCPTCGHAVMKATEACAYCGAILSQAEPDQNPGQSIIKDATPTEESASIAQQGHLSADADPAKEFTDDTAVPFKQSLSDSIDQILLNGTPPGESPPPGELKVEENTAININDRPAEVAFSEKANVLTSVPEALGVLIPADTEPSSKRKDSAQNQKMDGVNTDSEGEESPIIPEEIIEFASQDSIKSESLDVEQIENLDENDLQAELIPVEVPESHKTPTEAGFDLKIEGSENEIAPKDKIAHRSESALPSEPMIEEAIVLTADDEVKLPKKVSSDTAVKKTIVDVLNKKRPSKEQAKGNRQERQAATKASSPETQKVSKTEHQASKSQKNLVPAPEPGDTPAKLVAGVESNTKTLGLLKKYEGQSIGINYDNSADIREAELVEVNDEFFSVRVKSKEVKYSYPLKTLLTVIEGNGGVEIGETEPKIRFNAVIKVCPLILF